MPISKLTSAFAEGFDGFQETMRSLEAEWDQEMLPITVSMGAFGRAMVERAAAFQQREVSEVFQRVELLLKNGGELEKDAVATGFLEALAVAIDQDPARRWILDCAGPLAREYLAAWDQFCGLTDRSTA
jgi:hypothetical protein